VIRYRRTPSRSLPLIGGVAVEDHVLAVDLGPANAQAVDEGEVAAFHLDFEDTKRNFVDEIVIRSMLKWPDVPSVYGWLALDRRGDWLIKTVSGAFSRISNAAVVAFIGRNYAADGEGRWYFQNGPQRVFVSLHYTPWVWRLDDSAERLVAHTGPAAGAIRAGFVDESGALLLETALGIGVVSDRDLTAIAERMPESVARGEAADCTLFGARVRIAPIRAGEVAARFGYVPRPAPAAGEPEC
jgi:hypothetical protein